MNTVFPSPRDSKAFVDNPRSVSNTFKNTVAIALLTAMGTSARSISVELRGVAADAIREVLSELNRVGYRAQIVRDNKMDISW